MIYVKPDMDIIEFDKNDITTQLGVSDPESTDGNGNNTGVDDDMWD